MAKKKRPKDEPTQTTEQGYEIPVPKRKDVLDALRKVARPPESSDRESSPEE
ncbi:MAG: hypothetical protein QOC92_1413 [Acidimicrobiaceae bacterium]